MKLHILLLAVATQVFAMPASADDENRGISHDNPSAMTDEALLSIVRDGRWFADPCELGVPTFEEIIDRFGKSDANLRGRYLSRALCADREGRYADGRDDLAQLEEIFQSPFTDQLGFYFERRTEDSAATFARFEGLSYEGIRTLDPEWVWPSVRLVKNSASAEQFEDLTYRWSGGPEFAALDIDLQPGLAVYALRGALRADNLAKVIELLTYVRSPSSFVSLLADKRYEAAWPQIEQRAGQYLNIISKEYVDWAVARYENEPTDRDRFSEAARALLFAGEFQKVIDLAQAWRSREAKGLDIEEGDGWALNLEAYAHDALGEREEADRIFDYLASLDADQYPWTVNFVINRALRLVGHKKWQQGLEASDRAQEVANSYGSTFAKMLIAQARSCALYKLGRLEEAAGNISYLAENQSEHPQVAADAYMCLDRREDAVAGLMAALEDKNQRESVLDSFQGPQFDLFYTPSELTHVSELLESHPELKQRALEYYRILPDRLTPIAALKRKGHASSNQAITP